MNISITVKLYNDQGVLYRYISIGFKYYVIYYNSSILEIHHSIIIVTITGKICGYYIFS